MSKTKERQYIINESTLIELITASLELEDLEYSGVDNWEWYGVYRREHIQNACRDLSIEYEEDMTWEDIAKQAIESYTEEKGMQ